MSTALANKASQWSRNVQFRLLPGHCVACHVPSGRQLDLCIRCEQSLVQTDRPCLACALPLPAGNHAVSLCGACIGRSNRLCRTVAAFSYTDPVSSLIAAYKYRSALQIGRVLGQLLAERLTEAYRGQALPQLLVPVPLHPVRLRERGFNQALVLARQLGKGLNIPVAAEGLARTRQTPPQQGLSAKERKHNLRGAFRLQTDLRTYRSIALVDDVVTTMSTVHELARVLRRQHGGEPDLHVWCLARA